MQIRKKPIGRLGLGVLCSLSSSYMMLPFLIFSSLLTGETTAVNFFVPVVILYSIQRACLIALRGFGEITNPYRILRGGMLMTLAGAVLMAAVGAVVVAVCVFGTAGRPALLWHKLTDAPLRLAGLLAMLLVSAVFVFHKPNQQQKGK